MAEFSDTEYDQIERYRDAIITEIHQDISNGVVPADVPDFSTLHDHVDANEYLLTVMPELPDNSTERDYWLKLGNAVIEQVNERMPLYHALSSHDIENLREILEIVTQDTTFFDRPTEGIVEETDDLYERLAKMASADYRLHHTEK